MPVNWYALCASILNTELSVETALAAMGIGQPISTYKKLDNEDIEGMIRLKSEGMTFKEIGSIYGMEDHAVYRRIKRYKGKLT